MDDGHTLWAPLPTHSNRSPCAREGSQDSGGKAIEPSATAKDLGKEKKIPGPVFSHPIGGRFHPLTRESRPGGALVDLARFLPARQPAISSYANLGAFSSTALAQQHEKQRRMAADRRAGSGMDHTNCPPALAARTPPDSPVLRYLFSTCILVGL